MPLPEGSQPTNIGPRRVLYVRRQLVELGQPAVEQEAVGLRQRDGEQLLVRVVEPRRAVAAGPAVAARNERHIVWCDCDGHAESPAASGEQDTASRYLFWREVVGRHHLDRPRRQEPLIAMEALVSSPLATRAAIAR